MSNNQYTICDCLDNGTLGVPNNWSEWDFDKQKKFTTDHYWYVHHFKGAQQKAMSKILLKEITRRVKATPEPVKEPLQEPQPFDWADATLDNHPPVITNQPVSFDDAIQDLHNTLLSISTTYGHSDKKVLGNLLEQFGLRFYNPDTHYCAKKKQSKSKSKDSSSDSGNV